MSAPDWVTWAGVIAGSGGVGGWIYQLANAKSQTRKTKADTVQVITDASGKVVENLSRQLDKMQARIDLLEKKLDEREEREEQQERRLIIHEQWDRKVAERLRDLGEPIPDPPPLYPNPSVA